MTDVTVVLSADTENETGRWASQGKKWVGYKVFARSSTEAEASSEMG